MSEEISLDVRLELNNGNLYIPFTKRLTIDQSTPKALIYTPTASTSPTTISTTGIATLGYVCLQHLANGTGTAPVDVTCTIRMMPNEIAIFRAKPNTTQSMSASSGTADILATILNN